MSSNLSTFCPSCGASQEDPCKDLAGKEYTDNVHPSRMRLVEAIAELVQSCATDIVLEVEAHREQFFQENDCGSTMHYLTHKLAQLAFEVMGKKS